MFLRSIPKAIGPVTDAFTMIRIPAVAQKALDSFVSRLLKRIAQVVYRRDIYIKAHTTQQYALWYSFVLNSSISCRFVSACQLNTSTLTMDENKEK